MPVQSQESDLAVMSFGDHLEELRSRIIRSLGIAVLGTVVALVFQDRIVNTITAPHRKAMQAILVERGVDDALGKLAAIRTAIADIPVEECANLLRVAERSQLRDDEIEQRREALANVSDPTVRDTLSFLLAERERLEVIGGEQSAVRGLERRLFEVRALEDELRTEASIFATPRFEDLGIELKKLEAVVASWRAGADAVTNSAPRDVVSAGTWGRVEMQTEKLIEVRDRFERLSDPGGRMGKLHTFGYPESFFAHLKICVLVGILLGLPWITIEIWRFVAAGLYPRERKSVAPFMPLSLVFLIAGGTFAYTVLVPVGLTYLGSYGSGDVLEPTFRLKDYVSLVVTLILGMGLVFQLPLVMVFSTRSGMVSPDVFVRYRKYAILGALVVGSFLTPPDIVTQMLMAGPLVLLYEAGIIASRMLAARNPKSENPEDEAES